jgi:hypothetical protein
VSAQVGRTRTSVVGKRTCHVRSQRCSKTKRQTATDRRDGTQNRGDRCRNARAPVSRRVPFTSPDHGATHHLNGRKTNFG